LRDQPEALFSASVQERRQDRLQHLMANGLPRETAEELAGSADLATALTVIAAAESCAVAPVDLVQSFGTVGERLSLAWLATRVAHFPATSHWQAMERDALVDDLIMEQGRLAAQVHVDHDGDVGAWLDAHPTLARGWQRTIEDARHASQPDFSLYAITCRKLIDLGRHG
jgi:glutamate dehydrogenase